MSPGRRACLTLLAVFAGQAASGQELFDPQPVADGVYAALARPRTPINCNAAVVVYDEGVLVVDTHSRPSSANALIRQIRTLTDKPVRYAVNSHFHWTTRRGIGPTRWPSRSRWRSCRRRRHART